MLIYAAIPTPLYYFGCSADDRGRTPAATTSIAVRGDDASLASDTAHRLSLPPRWRAIAVALAMGFTPFMAVFWSIAVAFALSMIRADSRLGDASSALAAGPPPRWRSRFWDARTFRRRLGSSASSMAALNRGLLGVAAATPSAFVQGSLRLRARPNAMAWLCMTDALRPGARRCWGAATCACAGIIVRW